MLEILFSPSHKNTQDGVDTQGPERQRQGYDGPEANHYDLWIPMNATPSDDSHFIQLAHIELTNCHPSHGRNIRPR